MNIKIILLLGLNSSLLLQAATYEVAQSNPQASDGGPGTSAQPWKTIGAAVGKVAPGDTVLIHSGVYREHLEVKTNGTAERPICFRAAAWEHVVITGADQLTG